MIVVDASIAAKWFLPEADSGRATFPDEPALLEAVRLALLIRHPLQDCLYLALARRLEATLLTADPKLAERSAAAYARVRVLGVAEPQA